MRKIEEICDLESIGNYILRNRNYKNQSLEEQEHFILSAFHSKNWEKIKKTDRIILLREVENIEAQKLQREPFEIKLLPADYKWNEFYMDFYVDKKNRKIYSRRNFVEDGIMQVQENEQMKKTRIRHINYELLDCLYHEQYHIMTSHYFRIYQTGMENAYKEHSEYIVWGSRDGAMSIYNNQEMMKKRHYIYRMIPDEYYAFQYAEEKVKHKAQQLIDIYGEDKGYNYYLSVLEESKKGVVNNYYENTGDKEKLTYDQIYQKLLDSYIGDYEKECGCEVFGETKADLCLRKSIIEKKIK